MAAAWWAGVRVAGRVSDPATLLETEAALEPETSLSTEQPRRNARSEINFERFYLGLSNEVWAGLPFAVK